jgi:hypothetical protein
MKKEYTKPQLVKHGKLEEQTQSGGSSTNDGSFSTSS